MKYLKRFNESVGVNKDVLDFTDVILNFIMSQKHPFKNKTYDFDVKDIPRVMVNNYKIKSFKIKINNSGVNNMRLILYNSLQLDLILDLSIKSKLFGGKSFGSLEHELLHLYQFTRNIDKENKRFYNDEKNGIVKELENLSKYYKNYDYYSFNYLIYISLDIEISARVQQCYSDLVKRGTTKENFYENLKKDYAYKTYKLLDDAEVIDDIRGNEVKFVSIWKYLYENRNLIKNEFEFKGFWKFLSRIDIFTQLKKIVFSIFGPMKKFKYLKSIYQYKVLSEKESIKFVNEWDKKFKKSAKTYITKLSKLYSKF